MIEIRPAHDPQSADAVHVIKAVYDEFGFGWFPEGYHRDLYALDASYWETGDEFYLAYLDGAPVGTVAVEFFPAIPEGVTEPLVRIAGCDCSLERLYVLASARGMGLGRLLTEFAMRRASERGATRMEIWSDVQFEAAHRLYERLGAVQVAERLCDDPAQSPEYGLVLAL
ncbi:MAG: GNAT family N-acetyltransferase [Fimbriimonadaceae bacterium]|nr:GNAT family N-acetyltransferase [Fimbriimonadaceae bacterium]